MSFIVVLSETETQILASCAPIVGATLPRFAKGKRPNGWLLVLRLHSTGLQFTVLAVGIFSLYLAS